MDDYDNDVSMDAPGLVAYCNHRRATLMSNPDVEALKAFIDDNEELDQLETILDRFNLFKSLNLVRQEIRHSAFLRWLLDPSETHGLSDYWLRRFLRRIIKKGEGSSHPDFPSLFDLDNWNLGHV